MAPCPPSTPGGALCPPSCHWVHSGLLSPVPPAQAAASPLPLCTGACLCLGDEGTGWQKGDCVLHQGWGHPGSDQAEVFLTGWKHGSMAPQCLPGPLGKGCPQPS